MYQTYKPYFEQISSICHLLTEEDDPNQKFPDGVSPPCHNSNNSLGPEEHVDGMFFAVHRALLLQHFGPFVGELFRILGRIESLNMPNMWMLTWSFQKARTESLGKSNSSDEINVGCCGIFLIWNVL